jgi:hypothetical protein
MIPCLQIRTERPAPSVAWAELFCWSREIRRCPAPLVSAMGVTSSGHLLAKYDARTVGHHRSPEDCAQTRPQ